MKDDQIEHTRRNVAWSFRPAIDAKIRGLRSAERINKMKVRLLPHFDEWSRNERLLLLLGIVAAYMIAFKPIYMVVGEAVDALYFIPVAMAGWLLGTRGGLLFGFLSIPVNALLFSQFQEIGLIYLIPLYPMHLLAILVGSLTGRLKSLLDRLKNQTYKLEQEEKGHHEEIAERERLEDKLRKSEEKYRQLVENANEMIIVAQDGVLKFFNHKFIEISGYTEEELLFMPFSQLIHPEDQDKVVENHLKRLRNENLPQI
jgi:PAS domain-containing protein